MKFMLLLKGDRTAETGRPPGDELITAMNAFNQALTESGALLEANGLAPTAEGFRAVNDGGEITIQDGPFTDTPIVLFGYWVIQVPSRQAALEWAGKVPFEAGGPDAPDGQVEVRQVYELEDFPVGEDESGWREDEEALRAKPVPATPAPGKSRYLMMFRASKQSEAGELPDEAMLTAMGGFIGELAESGIFISGDGLLPSSAGTRVSYSAGKRTVTDGPFTETKELVAGYAVLEVDSREQAVELCRRGQRINGDGLSEVRKIWL
jgi:hypothetical protein